MKISISFEGIDEVRAANILYALSFGVIHEDEEESTPVEEDDFPFDLRSGNLGYDLLDRNKNRFRRRF